MFVEEVIVMVSVAVVFVLVNLVEIFMNKPPSRIVISPILARAYILQLAVIE